MGLPYVFPFIFGDQIQRTPFGAPVRQVRVPVFPDQVAYSTFWDPNQESDLDPNWIKISGPRSVLEKVGRRWITNKRTMHNPFFGYPVFQYHNANMLPVELQALQAGMRAQALEVQGLDDISVQLQKNDRGVVKISGDATLATGTIWPYVFQLSSDKLVLVTGLGPGGT